MRTHFVFFSTELGFSTPQKTEAFSLVNHGPYKLQKTLRLPTFCVLKKKLQQINHIG